MNDEPKSEVLARLKAAFTGLVPHNGALALELVDFDRERGAATMRLPYRAELVGNPDTGVLHGGVITTLLDACAGAAVFVRMWSPTAIATLDLRIDYLKPASPPEDVIAEATCYKLTSNVAFVRATAYHPGRGPDDPIASAAATFAIATKGNFAKLERA